MRPARLLAIAGLLAALAPRALAADILLPDPVARELNDLSVSFMFVEMVASAMRDGGQAVDDADAIRLWAGGAADECASNSECPTVLWPRTNARLAVVIVVGRVGTDLDVEVRLHGADDVAPFKVLRQQVAAGGERAYATEVARVARDALRILPERAAIVPTIALEDEVIPAPPRPTRTAPARKEPVEVPNPEAPPPVKPDPAPRPAPPPPVQPRPWQPDPEDEQRVMGIPVSAYRRYKASGLSREDWLRVARVRSGKVFLEFSGGWALGDTDRGYGVRTRLETQGSGFGIVGVRTWEGDGAGAGGTGGLHIGFAPAWFLDTGLLVAVQQGQKHLNTGWECLESICDPPNGVVNHDPVTAVQFMLEPRARVYPLPTGVVKPYLLAGFNIRVYDGFTVPDQDFIDYPNAAGGASFGPTAGLGVAVDVIAPLTIFVEVPGTLVLSDPERSTLSSEVTLMPTELRNAGYLLRMTSGLAVRF